MNRFNNSDEICKFIYHNNPIKTLSYLSKNKSVYGSKLAKDFDINQSSVSIILKMLFYLGIAETEKIGNTILYNVNNSNPIVKYFRIFENLIELSGLIYYIKYKCRRIILFGSCSEGTDNTESDFDILAVVDDEEKEFVHKAVSDYKIERKINLIIVNSIEFVEIENGDPVFYKEVSKGILLWGGYE